MTILSGMGTCPHGSDPMRGAGAPRGGFTRTALAYWGPLVLIWLGAIALRWALTQGERVVWGDEPFYLWLGRNWIEGEGFGFMGHADVHHGPLFPMVAGVLYLLTADMAVASEIIYVVLGAAVILPIYGMGSELYGRRVGLIAAAVTAVFPALTASVLHWGTMTEPLYLWLVTVGLWSGLVALRPFWRPESGRSDPGQVRAPWWSPGLAGLAFGLAYLTRPEAINYLVIIGLLIAVLAIARGALRRWRFWLGALLYLLAFALAFVPYAYYVRLQTGAWMVSEKVGVAYLTGVGLAHGDTAAFDRSTWGLDSTGLETFFFSSESYNVSMAQLILDDPKTFAVVLYMNVQSFVRVFIDWTLFPYALIPLAFLGLFYHRWTRERTLKELYLLLSVLPVMGFLLFFIQARYLLPIVPVAILWVSVGVARLGDWLIGTIIAVRTPEVPADAGRRPYWHMPQGWIVALQALPVVVVMAWLVAMHPMVIDQVTNTGSVRDEHRLLGEYLKGQVFRDTVIMCRYPAIAFHADARWVPTPNASLPEVLRYAQHKNVSYWVIDERELRYRPQFVELASGESIPDAWEAIARVAPAGSPSAEDDLLVLRLR